MATNYVGGNARVGIMAQNIVIGGGVTMGPDGIVIGGTIIATDDDDQDKE